MPNHNVEMYLLLKNDQNDQKWVIFMSSKTHFLHHFSSNLMKSDDFR